MDQRSQSHRPYPVCRNIMDNMEAWLILVCHVSKTRQIIPWSKDDKWGSKSVKEPADLEKWYQLLTFISGFMNDSALFSHDSNVQLELTYTNDDTSLFTSPLAITTQFSLISLLEFKDIFYEDGPSFLSHQTFIWINSSWLVRRILSTMCIQGVKPFYSLVYLPSIYLITSQIKSS